MNAVSLIRAGAVMGLWLALCGPGFAGEGAPDDREPADAAEYELPSFDAMLSAAMSRNAEIRAADSRVRVAQAEAERVRLEVAQRIREFRDEWNDELGALREAEAEVRDAERVVSLPEGAVAGRVVLQSERLVESSKQRVMLAENRLHEMEQILPLLLGSAADDHEGTPRSAGEDGGDAAAVNKVLRERLDVLTQIVEAQQGAFQHGEAGFDAVVAAQADVLEAKLELAQSGAERIEVLRELLEVARQLEQVTQEIRRGGRGSAVDVLKASAFRLRCEADLLREQSGR